MRKNTIIILLAAAMISCSKTPLAELSYGSRSVSASIPTEDVRTSIGEAVESGYKVIWNEGDAICVNGVASEALTAAEAGRSSAKFTMSEAVETPYNVIYPAEAYLSSEKASFPCAQTWSAGQFDPKASLMTAYSTSEDITFVHASAFVKVTIRKASTETLKEIKLYSFAGEPMSGTFAVDYATGLLTAAGETRNYVSLSAKEGITYSASGYAVAVFAVPAAVYTEGFAISITTTDGVQMGKKAYGNTGITLCGGDIIAMPELTFEGGASLYSGGTGTSADPYRIATAKDLVTLSEQASTAKQTAYFLQVADIDMSEVNGFTPIGNSSFYFAGIYDGNGRIIENLAISSTTENAALFGYLRASGAKVCNLNLKNVSVTSSGMNAGALCGFGYEGAIENCSFSNCKVTSTGTSGAGLACGRPYILSVSKCKADSRCSIEGKKCVGGLVGGGTTYASGKVLTITDSEFNGAVICSGAYAGGIIGGGVEMKGTSKVIIKSCTTSGTVTASGSYSGGIIGGVDPSSSSSINTTEILYVDKCSSSCSVKGTYAVGGIVGGCYGGKGSYSIMNCGYTGKEIESTTTNGSDGYNAVGGIIGFNRTGPASVVVANCYSHVSSIKFAKGTGTPVSYGAGGIMGYTSVANGYTGTIQIKGCYCPICLSGFLYNGSAIAETQTGFGALYGSFSSTLSAGSAEITDCWYSESSVKGDQRFSIGTNTSAVYSSLDALLSDLNKFAAKYTYGERTCLSWKKNSSGYPVLSNAAQEEETEDAEISGGNENEGNAGGNGGNFENNDVKDPIEW